jgi:hypothetical protein
MEWLSAPDICSVSHVWNLWSTRGVQIHISAFWVWHNVISTFRRICCTHYQTYTLKMDAACVLWNARPRLPDYTSLGWSKYNLSISITTVTEQVDVAANTPDLYSGGSHFESGLEHRQIWGFFRFSSARPGKCRNITSIRIRPLPSKSFSVHYLPIPILFTSI